MGEIILGKDIKTGKVIKDQSKILKSNLIDEKIYSGSEVIIVLSEKKEESSFKNIVKFYFTNPNRIILKDKQNMLYIVDGIQKSTQDLYIIGKPVYLVIINRNREIIARYEIL